MLDARCAGGTLSLSERVRRFREAPPQSRQQRAQHAQRTQHAQHAQHAQRARHGQYAQHGMGTPETCGWSNSSSDDSVQVELEQSADALLLAAQRALQQCSSRAGASGVTPAVKSGQIRPIKGNPAHQSLSSCLGCHISALSVVTHGLNICVIVSLWSLLVAFQPSKDFWDQ